MRSENFDWLQIRIRLLDRVSDDFALEVTFENCSKHGESVYWTFSNALGKAESLSLQLASRTKGRLEPLERVSGSPIRRVHEEFKFGAKQTYVIRGRLVQRKLLRLGTAGYLIEPGEEYEVAFQYSTARSNTVVWSAPSET